MPTRECRRLKLLMEMTQWILLMMAWDEDVELGDMEWQLQEVMTTVMMANNQCYLYVDEVDVEVVADLEVMAGLEVIGDVGEDKGQQLFQILPVLTIQRQ